jgi:hypothetical protein
MDARTRERLPVLPVLVRTVDQRRKTAGALLNAARQTEPGNTFTAAGQTLTRSLLAQRTITTRIWADQPAGGKRRDLRHEEEYAFWALAALEVFQAHRDPDRGTPGAQPPQPGAIPSADHRGDRAAAADRPLQDLHRMAPGCQPRTRRSALHRHPPDP